MRGTKASCVSSLAVRGWGQSTKPAPPPAGTLPAGVWFICKVFFFLFNVSSVSTIAVRVMYCPAAGVAALPSSSVYASTAFSSAGERVQVPAVLLSPLPISLIAFTRRNAQSRRRCVALLKRLASLCLELRRRDSPLLVWFRGRARRN